MMIPVSCSSGLHGGLLAMTVILFNDSKKKKKVFQAPDEGNQDCALTLAK